jgi:ABC-type phosphate transport system auxiliary subunit
MLKAALAPLSSDVLRTEMAAMQSATGALPFSLGVRGAFETLMSRLRMALGSSDLQADEMRQMLDASQQQLNAEFGFALVLPAAPPMAPFVSELQRIGQGYGRYLGVGQVWRMAAPGFAGQFRRMLHSKLRVVFENAAGEIEQWSKAAGSQAEVQLRERRRAYTRRREALQRVQAATGELEQRITEVQDQGEALNTLQQRLQTQVAQVLALAQAPERPALRQSAA